MKNWFLLFYYYGRVPNCGNIDIKINFFFLIFFNNDKVSAGTDGGPKPRPILAITLHG